MPVTLHVASILDLGWRPRVDSSTERSYFLKVRVLEGVVRRDSHILIVYEHFGEQVQSFLTHTVLVVFVDKVCPRDGLARLNDLLALVRKI